MKRKIKTRFLPALLLVAATQTARAQAQATIGGITYNDEGGYYVIDEADDLSDLAVYVNGAGTYRNGQTEETTAHNCEGLKFKMIQDITFEYDDAWNEASSTENNYVPIGSSGSLFKGDFDGDGHTVSGIRIYRGGSTYEVDNYQGIFGRTWDANIRGLRLADARITGYQYIGGIVGDNTDGTITDCHVANDVCIHAVQSNAMLHGGIAGYNLSYLSGGVATVESCTSAATLTIADEENATGCYDYGAIVGLNSGTLTGNFAIGATVPAATNNRYGAIAGRNGGNNATLQQNYYIACKVASENVTPTGVGCQNADVTANDGAVSIPAVTLGEGVSIISPEKPTITYGGTNYYRTGETLTLGATADATAGYESYGYFVDGSYQLTPGADGICTYIVDATHGNVTITLFGIGAIDWATVNKGTAEDPYMIYNRYQLDLLSRRVNGLDENPQSDDFSFSGKFFRLGADIVYTHKNADEEDADIEPNYMSIGGYDGSQYHYFKGDFDGAGHTISGIRIYNDWTGDYDNYQGIFGLIGSGANIHGLRLADARITGYRYIGGIVGHNYCGNITDCHVANDVCIHAVQSGAMWHGGIAGYNQTYFDGDATIERCTSAATLTIADDATGCYNYGGIVGYNSGTLTGNLAIGVTVPAAGSENRHGAIAGNNSGGTLANNYYTACKIASANVTPTGVGCGGIGNAAVGYKADDVATDDGAVPALRDDASNAEAIALLAALASAADGHTPVDLGWGAGLFPLQLADRTLTKDGKWNTLCLPFSVTTLAGTPLEGATIKELDNSGSGTSLSDDGVLTLKFTAASSIAAGKPYIVKWEGASGTAIPLTFADVTIAGTEPTEVVSSDGNVKFVGQYSPFGITSDNISSILYIASDNKIGYSASSRTLKALRAHFWVKPDGTAPAARRIDIDFGDGEATSITLVSADSESAVSGVYTLDGRKLSGQPTTKGVYIVNGKKIVVE